MHDETQIRSVLKAVSWRFMGSVVTAALVLAFTSNWKWAMEISLSEVVLKIGAYFVHERIWNLVPYGRAGKAITPRSPAP